MFVMLPPAVLTKNPVAPMQPLKPPFRLPQEWYQEAIRRLQARLAEAGLDGILCESNLNIVYFTGLFHSKTERPFWLFIPKMGDPTIFCPGLDRDLAGSWWISDYEWYFDYPHHGEFNRVVYEPGPPVDLWKWVLQGLQRRGFGRATIGLDTQPVSATVERLKTGLPQATFRYAGDICLAMRQIKTPAELEIIQKALDFQDHMLEYARALILEYGSTITDFEVRMECERYGITLLMDWLDLDGRPHNGVGIDFWFTCRAGRSTAYPHPNQYFYHRIQPGDAVQLAGFIHLGGYVGEAYRAVQILPAGPLHHKLWDAHTRMTELQIELSRAGMPCNQIASQVLKLGREAGVEPYIFHRPAHGIGMEGHQEPAISLGEETVLKEGMLLSNEPGLYSPQDGFGYNHSNTILVEKERGRVLNKTPLTKEWCWLEL